MAVGRFVRSQLALPTARSGAPPQMAIEVAMDLVAVLDHLRAQVAGLGALQLHVMIGTKSFQHGIEALTRPGKQVTKAVDRHPIVVWSDAPIGRLKLLALGLGL